MSRETRLAARRERKFDKHAIQIKEEKTSEERGKGDNRYMLTFTHAVYAGRQLIARATSRRYALKAAHNWISRR